VIVMTTNAGAHESSRTSIGFTRQDHASDAMEAIKRLFTPEFRNRLDDIIHFNALTEDIMKKVVDKFMKELKEQLAVKKVSIRLSDGARTWLAKNGHDPRFGARPLGRLIQTKIKDSLSDEILFGRLVKGGEVLVDLENDKLTFSYSG